MLSGHQPHGPNLGNIIFGTSISMATVLLQILIGPFEELIVRGYLMTEVKRFTGSILFAILCSVAVQTSYHFYQGGPLALAHIGGFLVFAMFYAKTNRILPIILAHSALDLNALVMHALSLP
jgi:membrane protease YdiL (CAAX protease family)